MVLFGKKNNPVLFGEARKILEKVFLPVTRSGEGEVLPCKAELGPTLAWGRDRLGPILAGRERAGAGVGLLLPEPSLGSPHSQGI